VNFIEMTVSFAVTSAYWYQEQASLGYFGNILNDLGDPANRWFYFGEYQPPDRYLLGFFGFDPNSGPSSFGLGGCTPSDYAGRPAGYQTCPSGGFGGALIVQGHSPETFDVSSFAHGLVSGSGYMANIGGYTSWACDPTTLGRSDAGFVSTGPCDVFDDPNPLDVGPVTWVVTPEPATLVLVATGMCGLLGIGSRRAKRQGLRQSRINSDADIGVAPPPPWRAAISEARAHNSAGS
jgi:hypothetical protein